MRNSRYAQFTFFRYLLVLFFLCSGCQPQVKEKKETEQIIPVRVVRAEKKVLRKVIEYVGNVRAQEEILVYPKVTGKVAEKIKEEAAVVEKGEAFLYLDRDEIGLTFAKAPVESPIRGIIGRIYVDQGSSVTPQTPVALIVNMEKVKIEVDIPEIYLPKIYRGQEARIAIDAYPTEQFVGIVYTVSPVLDVATRTAPIEIILANSDLAIKPGMFARAKIILEEQDPFPVILKESLLGSGEDAYVYVVQGQTAVKRKVKIGLIQDSFLSVLEGLAEDEPVVIMGQQRLFDGALVNVEE